MAHGSFLNAVQFLLGTDYSNELFYVLVNGSLCVLYIRNSYRGHLP